MTGELYQRSDSAFKATHPDSTTPPDHAASLEIGVSPCYSVGMVRCGIDLIEVSRIRAALERHGERLRKRVYTPVEIAYCSSVRNPWPHYAVRFAAKEAFFKSLSPGALEALVWREIGIRTDETGSPRFELSGDTRARLAGWVFSVSLSHVRELAVAQVLSRPPGDRTGP